jgi:parallel beta-helix repeat protein
LSAGDTLYIRGGRYNQRIFEVDFAHSGTSWSKPITIAAAPGESVTIETVGGDNAVRFQDGSIGYVELNGIVIDGSTAADISQIVFLGAASHHIRFKNVEIKDAQGNGILGGGTSHEFLNMNVHGCGRWGGYSIGANGLYLTTHDSLVEGGQFWNNRSFGVRFFNSAANEVADNNIVRKARIYGNGQGIGLDGAADSTSGGGGIVLGDVGNTADGNTVNGNYEGILVFGSKAPSGMKLYNNTVTDNVSFGIEIQSGASNTDVRGNTVRGNAIDIMDLGSNSHLSNNGP